MKRYIFWSHMGRTCLSLLLALFMIFGPVSCTPPPSTSDYESDSESDTALDTGTDVESTVVTDTDTQTETDTETETNTEPETSPGLPNLPKEQFPQGSTVVFITRDAMEWSSMDIYSADGNERAISDAVLRRNERVRNHLGVEVQEYKANDSVIHTAVQQAISGGLSDYQAVVSASHTATRMANSGWLRDLNSHTINYLDVQKPWWDTNLADELSVGGHLYFATGDMMILDNDATFCLLFNKTIQEDNHIPNLYDMVENHEWTMDKMLEYISLTASNDDGGKDIYGMLRTSDTPFAIYYGAGVRTVSKDQKTDTLNYTLDVKHAGDVATKAKQLFSKIICYNISDEWAQSGMAVTTLGQKYFGYGQAFLYSNVLQCVARMRAFDVDFGVLPYPLFDKNQPSYYHMMHVEGTVVSIPRSASLQGEKLDMVTATLEAMAYYSTDTLTKRYYEINLTSKFIDDPESAPMIDLVLNTRVFDLPYYFDLTPGQENITYTLAQCMLPGSRKGVAAATGNIGDLLERKIEQLVTSMDNHSSKFGE